MIKISGIGPIEVGGGLLVLLLCYVLYNIFLHPLRRYPGPWYTAASRFWFITRVYHGTIVYDIKALHDKYGDVVRVAPNELSYVNPDAWQEIYGRNVRQVNGEKKEASVLPKDAEFYSGVLAEAKCYADVEGEPYRIQKKAVLGGLTKKSNIIQEDIIRENNVRLIQNLHTAIASGKSFDITPYLKNLAMDFIVNFICGHDLQAFKHGSEPHSACVTTDRAFKLSIWYLQFRRLSSFIADPLEAILGSLTLRLGMLDYMDFVSPLLKERLKTESPGSKDIVSYMKGNLPDEDVMKNSIMLTLAGSEATVAVLSATLYFIAKFPETQKRIQEEVRGKFQRPEDMTIESCEHLAFVQACISEAIRLFPPFWGAAPRKVPEGGAMICGGFVPATTTVSIYHRAMYTMEKNFKNSGEFIPDRWMGDRDEVEYKAYHPFSFGPRTCIGKETSSLVSRLIMAQLIWAFDFELGPESEVGWDRPLGYMAAVRDPLFLKVKERVWL